MELGRLITGKGVNAPVLIAGVGTLSLGFLSNSDDEAVLVTEENMAAVAEAISVFCEEFV